MRIKEWAEGGRDKKNAHFKKKTEKKEILKKKVGARWVSWTKKNQKFCKLTEKIRRLWGKNHPVTKKNLVKKKGEKWAPPHFLKVDVSKKKGNSTLFEKVGGKFT